jgi:sialidase-1
MKTKIILLLIGSIVLGFKYIPGEKEKSISQLEQTSRFYCAIGKGGTRVHTERQQFKESFLFKQGTDGYHSFKVPAIIRTKRGTLLAFCEGIKKSSDDTIERHVVYKRSMNNGTNWSDLEVLFSKEAGDCSSPTPVADMKTGDVFVFMSYQDEQQNKAGKASTRAGITKWGQRRVYLRTSLDDGQSWEDPQDLTKTLLPRHYTWDIVGPGNGIQLQYGPKAERLIVPALGRNIYSDNHGGSWRSHPIKSGTSEGTIIQLCNGDLLRNDRAEAGAFQARKRRQVSTSSNNGNSWSIWKSSEDLIDSPGPGSLIRYNHSYPQRLVFINAATTLGGLVNQKKMTVKVSYDEGRTWPVERLLDANNGGYSSLVRTEDNQIASVQELRENNNRSSSIKFRRFNLSWVLNGKPEPVK